MILTGPSGEAIRSSSLASALKCSRTPSIESWLITPDIMTGAASYFGDYKLFPAGNYRISYVNGALQTVPDSDVWSVNEPQVAPYDGYYIDRLGIPTPDLGLFPRPAAITDPLTDHYATFALAVAAYTGLYVDLTFAVPTVIGMVLIDADYTDNRPGTPNPTFRLTKR